MQSNEEPFRLCTLSNSQFILKNCPNDFLTLGELRIIQLPLQFHSNVELNPCEL